MQAYGSDICLYSEVANSLSAQRVWNCNLTARTAFMFDIS